MNVKKLHPDAILPSKAGPSEAGFDLYTLSGFKVGMDTFLLRPHTLYKCPTGVSLEIPEGSYGDIRPRSSAILKGLHIAGTIDSSYRGEIMLLIRNITNETIAIVGRTAYAQIVITPYIKDIAIVEVDKLNETERGDKGFGSTTPTT